MSDPTDEAGATETVDTSATDTGQTETATDTTQTPGTTEATSQAGTEESFFDPTSLDPTLLPAYKQMQGAFTQKMQAAATDRRAQAEKVAAYDAFYADPEASIRQEAARLGLNFAQAEQAQQEFAPDTWEDVSKHIREQAKQEILRDLQPFIQEMQSQKRSSIEQALDASVPEWRQYEDDMSSLLGQHPTLVNDPQMLARLAIPEEVQKGKAMQAALAKLQDKGKAAQATSGSQTPQVPDSLTPKKGITFAESVELAKKQLAAGKAA